MRPSEWLKERIEAAANHQKLVWVEDPYRLLECEEVAGLHSALDNLGHTLIVVTNAFRLREAFADLGAKSGSTAMVVVDQVHAV